MLTARRMPTRPAATTLAERPTIPGPHRQRFNIEVAYFHTVAEIDDCLATPVSGRRVVLYGGRGKLPPALADMTDRVVRADGVDPLKAAVFAHALVRDGDTLTLLLPVDLDGPSAELLLGHARRWYSSPHSAEDDVHFG